MADEQENETPDTPETAAEAPVQEAAASESPAAEAAAGETPAPEAASPSAPPAEPAEQLAPKERRRRARSTHTGTAREPRSAEERHSERVETRRRKAARRRARRLQERQKRSAARASGATAATAPLTAAEREPGARKVRQGVVVSDKADKTITVRIDVARRHRRYEKIVRSSNTLHAHDEGNEAHEGDTVRVVESRPLSRTKRWRLVDVVEKAR